MMHNDQQGVVPEQGHAVQAPPDGGCADSHAAPATEGHAHPEAQAGDGVAQGGYGQMGSPQIGVPGPDMGQPHFSEQFPGAAPYQGAPLAGQQVGVGGQTQPQGPMPGAQMSGYMPGYVPGYQPGFQPGYQPGYVPGYQPGFNPGSTATQAPGVSAPMPGAAQGAENRYGELYGLIQEAANGNPDVSKFLNFFQSSSSDFWKGALVGAGLSALFCSPAVKSALAGGLGGLWGKVSGGAQRTAEEMEAEEDRKAEARYAEEQLAKEQHAKETTA